MGALSTHVLDTTCGRPGHSIKVTLYRIVGDGRQRVRQLTTNDDGRCNEPLASGEELTQGVYELLFSLGPYFKAQGIEEPVSGVRFLDDVVIRFGVPDAGQHYHVPLLITPFSYSTYRGS